MANYFQDESSVYLTSRIPDFEIHTTSKSFTVELKRSGTLVFSTTLYTFDNVAYACDIRSIIEQDLLDNGLTFAFYSLDMDDGHAFSTISEFTAVFCQVCFNADTDVFLLQHFLTNSTSKQISRNHDELYYFIQSGEEVDPWQFVVYKDSNEAVHSIKTFVQPRSLNPEGGINEIQFITVDPSIYTHLGKILAITTNVGKRSFTHYYTDAEPSLKLYFRNIFNMPEQMHLMGVTSRKTEVERSTAVTHRTTCFYDQQVNELREFESAPMTRTQADKVSEMVASHEVRIIDRQYSDCEKLPIILITDSSVEIKDAMGELNTVKFTYRYDDDVPHISDASFPSQPFVETYTLPYT